MDNRLYFIIGDLLSNIVAGVVTAWLSYLIVSTDWNMFLAMWAMMLLGMLLSMVLFFPAGRYFGAMEVMLPMMLTGMCSGMLVGMWVAMSNPDLGQVLFAGGLTGLFCILAVWFMNSKLRGPRDVRSR